MPRQFSNKKTKKVAAVDVLELCVYKWLRPDDLKEQIASCCAHVKDLNTANAKALHSTGSSSSLAGKRESAKKGEIAKDSAVQAAMNMFA